MKLFWRALSLVMVATLGCGGLLVVDAVVLEPSPSFAAASGAFDPGMIISDSVFYDGGALSAAQVQTFLNTRVRACRSGFTCLKDFRQSTTSQPSRSQGCAALEGRQNETAAEIIYRVGVACGISQKVLLVLLEKEQGLVSSTAPTFSAFRSATGYGCPDTAACDSTYYGFFNQVYQASWQYKKYQARASSYGYVAGRWNTIQWHPNRDCGSSQVFIRNQATAGLYIYTPYRPNSAALNNPYGTGDTCSSYGNRNFWRIFRDWFGSTNLEVHPELSAFYGTTGGTNGSLGVIMSAPAIYSDGGVGQRFAGGWLYWNPATGAQPTGGAIGFKHVALNGPRGDLGYPTHAEFAAPIGGMLQQFQKGWIHWNATRGASAVFGGMNTAYANLGGPTGLLKAPLGDEHAGPRGGAIQSFERGTLYWSNPAGAFVVFGGVASAYGAFGGPGGSLGYPVGSEQSHGVDRASQRFQAGLLYWTPARSSQVVGGILTNYLNRGGPQGALGAPLGNEAPDGRGGSSQQFEGGTIYWSSRTGAVEVSEPIRSLYVKAAGSAGVFGYPSRSSTASDRGIVSQSFERGMAVSSSRGNYGVFSGMLFAYQGLNGPQQIGAPLGDEHAGPRGGAVQSFERGTLYWSDAAGAFVVFGGVASAYGAFGGPGGSLGYPVGSEQSHGVDRASQRFQSGLLYWTPMRSSRVVGGILASYLNRGGPQGALGAPLGNEAPDGRGGASQQFEGGTIYWSS